MPNNFLQPDWSVPKNIHAAMSFRLGGVSRGAYDSFNLAVHVNDDEQTVLKNRHILRQQLQLPSEPIWLEQIHSATVVEADKVNTQTPTQADASFTTQSAVVCAVLTADCLPILLCSQDGESVASIHAGWRGLLAGVISNTIQAMRTQPLIAWLGVAIGRCCFEVGEDVRTLFIAKNKHNASAFQVSSVQGKYLADIYQLARIELAEHQVSAIYGGQYCSVCDEQKFYSYRRDGETGRMATLIWKD